MRRVAMLVALALMAACGSEDNKDAADDGGEPAEDAATEEDPRDLEADQELADGAVLTIDDVPAGFEVEPEDEDDGSDEQFDQLMADCLGLTVAEMNEDDDEPQATASFSNDADDEVGSDVVVLATEDEVVDDLETVRDPAAPDCFADTLTEVFATSGEVGVGQITVEELAVEDLGDDSYGFGLTIPLSVADKQPVLYFDMVFIQQGRTEITMSFSAFDAPFDEELAYDLAATVVDRIPADA
jgi:hypothetical protein